VLQTEGETNGNMVEPSAAGVKQEVISFIEPKAHSINRVIATEQPIKVLIVDDSAVYRKLLEQTLADRQYVLIFATNGHEAMHRIAEHHPDLVIVDWMMPDLTGLEVCEHIRSKPDSADSAYSYIIVLTGKSEKQNVVAGLGAGADDYLTKPFDKDELIARVAVGHRVIQLHREVEAKNALLQELALTDMLTGLPNRRAIEEWAARQLSGAVRHGFSFHVVMSDIDHFKLVNDTHGHDAGDFVLRKFAQMLKTNCRSSDICGRMGGEEFLLAFSHSSDENALLFTERLRAQLEAALFVFNGQVRPVTASFGIAGLQTANGLDFSSLVSRADSALYLAKRGGRNRVEIAPTVSEALAVRQPEGSRNQHIGSRLVPN
jgi:two-component system, cell cycle response regulator